MLEKVLAAVEAEILGKTALEDRLPPRIGALGACGHRPQETGNSFARKDCVFRHLFAERNNQARKASQSTEERILRTCSLPSGCCRIHHIPLFVRAFSCKS